jgi:general stress protein YciG
MSLLGVQQNGMSAREAGQKGGEAVKKKYGPEYYKQIGRKGGEATRATHGHEFYEAIGKMSRKRKDAVKQSATTDAEK